MSRDYDNVSNYSGRSGNLGTPIRPGGSRNGSFGLGNLRGSMDFNQAAPLPVIYQPLSNNRNKGNVGADLYLPHLKPKTNRGREYHKMVMSLRDSGYADSSRSGSR